ncbi:MAG TPA: hypothetical protein VF932_03255 [Anaerolineae bacterium]
MSTKSSPSISIRLIKTWDEYLAAEELQRVVWQMPDWRDVVPANLMITVQKNSGIVLGAFDGDRLVGLAFSFIGIDRHIEPPVTKHCSHMLAVLPDYQSLKIGLQLKLQQRALALSQGIPLMTWTYDPLLALNANLNLSRLGAIARRYVENAYGEMTDGLNAGMASDRFEVEWWLDAPRVQARAAGPATPEDWQSLLARGAREAFLVSRDEKQLPHVEGEAFRPSAGGPGESWLVEIPADLPAVKLASPALAGEWRSRTRSFFERAFAADYAATGFVFSRQGGFPRAAYLLTRDPVETGCPA